MTQTALILVPILIADLFNLTLLSFMIFAAGSDRPLLNTSALLLGHTLAYIGMGFVLAYTLDLVAESLANPGSINFLIGLIVGVLLLWVSFRTARKNETKEAEPKLRITPFSAFGLGVVVSFIGMPFALPYLAAIDQILKADLAFIQAFVLLLVYNLLYATPFAIVPVLVARMGVRSHSVLQRLSVTLGRIAAVVTPWFLGLVGLALILDSALFFLTGRGLV